MAIGDTSRARAPRGTRQVTTAFFVALGDVPDAQRASVAKAAVSAIRDELKAQRDKAKAASVRAKTKTAAAKSKPARKVVASGAMRRRPRATGIAA